MSDLTDRLLAVLRGAIKGLVFVLLVYLLAEILT